MEKVERCGCGKKRGVMGKGNSRWGFFEVSEVMYPMGFRDLPIQLLFPWALLGPPWEGIPFPGTSDGHGFLALGLPEVFS